jgi:hypothetical protein
MDEKLREINRKYQREWRAKNLEKAREYQREWRRKNPDKVAEYNIQFWTKRYNDEVEKEVTT